MPRAWISLSETQQSRLSFSGRWKLFWFDCMKSITVFHDSCFTLLHRLMDIAKEMTREALPIKCLEAVILGMYLLIFTAADRVPADRLSTGVSFNLHLLSYLTNSMPGVERFPISFQSQFSGNHFHHIVLGVHSGGRFGALGISRREDLMFKPLELRTLTDLVQDFEGAYRGYWHTLRKVRIGQYVSHDPHSVEQIEWKHSILDLEKLTKEELRKELERHTRDMRLKVQHHRCSDNKTSRVFFNIYMSFY